MIPDLGLALSGGGSRAAAFHRGTVQALDELGLIPRVKVLSSVSGGSVFAAAWLAARARKQSDAEFLRWMGEVLERGFIRPALTSWRALKMIAPGWSRTNRIAETFDEILFEGLMWKDLPETPLLCLNTACLNNAESGRFSQTGFSCKGVGVLVDHSYQKEGVGLVVDKRYQEAPVTGVSLGFATAASAAFPFGLPPLSIARDRFGFPLDETLEGCSKLTFTDGGILENLGIERLLKSGTFGTTHILASDAGHATAPWKPGGVFAKMRSGLIYALSSEILERLLSMMNDKQNKSMRELLHSEVPGKHVEGRRVMFVQMKATWEDLTKNRKAPDLERARAIYDEMGGDAAVKKLRDVATSFVGLPKSRLQMLSQHAQWQVHAAVALYGAGLRPAT